MLFLARLAFWTALGFALAMACLPHPPQLPGDPGDKLLHVAAFTVLSILAALAYPRLHLLAIFFGLVLFGGIIELVQSIPSLHREADVHDWLADTTASATSLLAIAGVKRLFAPRATRLPR